MVKYTLSPQIMVQDVVSETVILDMNAGHYYELNEMGTVMLKRLSELEDPDLVIDALLKEYDVEKTELSSDLANLINHLQTKGLITPKSS